MRTATVFTFGPEIRIVNEHGKSADTTALIVGRRVSVFTDNTIILESCPSKAYAARVVLR